MAKTKLPFHAPNNVLDDDTLPLQKLAETGSSLTVPWMHQFVALGTGFESTRVPTPDPWVTSRSPFSETYLRSLPLVYEGRAAGTAKFRDSESTSHSRGSEHLSGSLGVTVSTPFVSANVTGTYDKTVLTSNDSNRVSRTCLVRVGTVRFKEEPGLSSTATAMLSGPNGVQRFRESFGDYFVSSYVLGGDSGVYVASSHESTETHTKKSVTVTIKVLFFKKSWTKETEESSFTETFQVTLAMYDTLNNTHDDVAPKEPHVVPRDEFLATVAKCSRGLNDVQELPRRVSAKLKELHLDKEHAEISWDKCADVCKAGVVVQLVLMPFNYLRDYKMALLSARPS